MSRKVIGLVPLLVLAGGWIALERFALPNLLLWAAASGLGIVLASAALRARPVREFACFAGVVLGAAAAMVVGEAAFLMGMAAFCAVLWLRGAPPRSLTAHVVNALLAGLPLLFGALSVGLVREGILPATLGAWVQLVRELVREVEQQPRGAARSPRIVWTAVAAMAFIPVSFVWPAHASYHGAYFLTALFADLGLLAVATRLLVGRTDRLSFLTTGAMAVAILALVIGRIV